LTGDGKRKLEPRLSTANQVYMGYEDKDLVRRQAKMTITFEEFLSITQQNCTYCGIEPSNRYNSFLRGPASLRAITEGLFVYNGMDRIDSSLPHITGNVVPCCFPCNRAKNKRSNPDFLSWVNRLAIRPFYPVKVPNIPFPADDHPIVSSIQGVFYNYEKWDDNDLTIESFYAFSQLDCFYCGTKSDNSNLFNYANYSAHDYSAETKRLAAYRYNGLDRIDTRFPHNLNNVITSCKWCNYAKQGDTLAQFHDWISRIQSHQSRIKFNWEAEIARQELADQTPHPQSLDIFFEP
jgi:hypothetical protein